MCHYTHLTPFEREKILFFLAKGKSVTEIAHLLDRSKSTISRELRRNAAPTGQPISYCPLTAQTINKKNLGYKKFFKRQFPYVEEILFFFSDQDDVWDERKIEIILNTFKSHPNVEMVFHDAELVDENLQQIHPSLWGIMEFNYHEFEKHIYSRFMKGNVVQGAASAFNKILFQIANPFPKEAIHDEWLALNAIPNGGINRASGWPDDGRCVNP